MIPTPGHEDSRSESEYDTPSESEPDNILDVPTESVSPTVASSLPIMQDEEIQVLPGPSAEKEKTPIECTMITERSSPKSEEHTDDPGSEDFPTHELNQPHRELKPGDILNFNYLLDGTKDGAYFHPQQLWGILLGSSQDLNFSRIHPHLPDISLPQLDIPQVDGAISSSSPYLNNSPPTSPGATCMPFKTRIGRRTEEVLFPKQNNVLPIARPTPNPLNRPPTDPPSKPVSTSPPSDNYNDNEFTDQDSICGKSSLEHTINSILNSSFNDIPTPRDVHNVPLDVRCNLGHVLTATLPLAPEAVVTNRIQDLSLALSPIRPLVCRTPGCRRAVGQAHVQDESLTPPDRGNANPALAGGRHAIGQTHVRDKSLVSPNCGDASPAPRQ